MKQLFVDTHTRYDIDEYGEVFARDYTIEALYVPEMCIARMKIRQGAVDEFTHPVNVTTQVAAVRMMLGAYDNWLDNLVGFTTWQSAAAAARVLREADEAREMAVVA